MQSILSHPATPNLSMLAIMVLTIGFTPPASLLRLSFLLIIPFLFIQTIKLSNSYPAVDRTMYVSTLESFALQYLDSVVLSAWSFDAQGPTSALGGLKSVRSKPQKVSKGRHDKTAAAPDTITARLHFGFLESMRSRYIGTPWEVKNIPPFSASNPSFVPSRTQFLTKGFFRTFIYLSLVDLASLAPPPDPVLLHPPKSPS
ncbi:MAG: hypothetical protein MMC33_000228 [Icmadophila ericetorum]|nr:hypothetical protein [Icmadophila ericetorum]